MEMPKMRGCGLLPQRVVSEVRFGTVEDGQEISVGGDKPMISHEAGTFLYEVDNGIKRRVDATDPKCETRSEDPLRWRIERLKP